MTDNILKALNAYGGLIRNGSHGSYISLPLPKHCSPLNQSVLLDLCYDHFEGGAPEGETVRFTFTDHDGKYATPGATYEFNGYYSDSEGLIPNEFRVASFIEV
jgi:hypothetical protein